jgi:hypothetical protein
VGTHFIVILKNPDSEVLRVALSNVYFKSYRYKECWDELEQIKKIEEKYPYLLESFELQRSTMQDRPMAIYG